MTISFDGGKTMMNFAEAALLIQGSTCIYGRKVSFSLAVGWMFRIKYINLLHADVLNSVIITYIIMV